MGRSHFAVRLPAVTRRWGMVAALTLLALLPQPVAAQQEQAGGRVSITLREAVDEALAGNPEYRVAGGMAAIARADARSRTARLLPALETGVGYTRSVDPVFAFGTRLRQERFAQADFAPDALNRPDPITDWTMELGLRWSLLDPSAWAGRSAARSRADAAGWDEAWARARTTFMTKALYFGAVGARARFEVAESEEAAARATQDLFRRRRAEGLLTEADLLGAEAELRTAEATRIEAARDVQRAREDLALQLGRDIEQAPEPADSLTAIEPPGPVTSAVATRADLRALAAARSAVAADTRGAGFSFLPRIESFAGWSSHARRALGVDGSDWTVGLALRWTVFSGFGRFAERQRAVEAREIARIREGDATRKARAETAQVHRDVLASWSGLEATRAAARAAQEARGLMVRRFEEGLATAAELLQAEARAAAARGREIQALVAYNIALARLELVTSAGAGPVADAAVDGAERAAEEMP